MQLEWWQAEGLNPSLLASVSGLFTILSTCQGEQPLPLHGTLILIQSSGSQSGRQTVCLHILMVSPGKLVPARAA